VRDIESGKGGDASTVASDQRVSARAAYLANSSAAEGRKRLTAKNMT
jgi:hypothetical protein